jgi:hypothetical protein
MYVKLTDGTVSRFPYSLGQLKADNRNVSFPPVPTAETLAEYEVFSVVRSTPPACDSLTHRLTQGVVKLDGVWTEIWTEVELPEDEASENIRNKRNARLATCDWTQLADSPLDADSKAAWALYRESLRRVPQQAGFPWNVQWPSEPGTN